MDAVDIKQPEFYFKRELSLLQFQSRVLAQASDESVPLLERLRFLCISSTNLDEFFRVRVSVRVRVVNAIDVVLRHEECVGTRLESA